MQQLYQESWWYVITAISSEEKCILSGPDKVPEKYSGVMDFRAYAIANAKSVLTFEICINMHHIVKVYIFQR